MTNRSRLPLAPRSDGCRQCDARLKLHDVEPRATIKMTAFNVEAAPQQFFKHLRRYWYEMAWVHRFNFRIAFRKAPIFGPKPARM
jgi:hypothetical protein